MAKCTCCYDGTDISSSHSTQYVLLVRLLRWLLLCPSAHVLVFLHCVSVPPSHRSTFTLCCATKSLSTPHWLLKKVCESARSITNTTWSSMPIPVSVMQFLCCCWVALSDLSFDSFLSVNGQGSSLVTLHLGLFNWRVRPLRGRQ